MLAGALKPADVNEPLKYLTLRSLTDAEEAIQACKDIGGVLYNPNTFAREIGRLTMQAESVSVEREGWKKLDFAGGTYTWAGPFGRTQIEDAVAEPKGLTEALQREGLDVTGGLLENSIERSRGFSP